MPYVWLWQQFLAGTDSFRNFEARHSQFAMNARRTSGAVVGDRPEDEVAQFPAHALPSSTAPMPGKPHPIELEPCAMPSNNALRLGIMPDARQTIRDIKRVAPVIKTDCFHGCNSSCVFNLVGLNRLRKNSLRQRIKKAL